MRIFALVCFLVASTYTFGSDFLIDFSPKNYVFSNEEIDVIIPACAKDIETLEHCIAGIKANCKRLRRVIVVSPTKLTDNAEWYDEALYPFSKLDIATALMKGDSEAGKSYISHAKVPVGWYLQQLLKFYAPFVIPGISSNVLVLDADAIFLNPVEFLTEEGAGLYNVGVEYHKPYFVHGAILLPGFLRVFKEYSGVTHHMLLQREILIDLMQQVERYHDKEFWKAMCECVDTKSLEMGLSGMSEYEIYFNFVFRKCSQVCIRKLVWEDTPFLEQMELYKLTGYHYIAVHGWLRSLYLPKKN